MSNQSGKEAEDRALRYLQQNGLQLVESNFSCRFGEIDLIMQEGETLVFVEVRYRKQNRFGSALESVDRRKMERLTKTAQLFLQQHKKFAQQPCRFDVIGLGPDQGRIDWINNAFDNFA